MKKKIPNVDSRMRPELVFPHAALMPVETVPRITPEHAAEVIAAIKTRADLYPSGAAIIIAVWQGALVKYLIDDQQVCETLRRFHKGAKR